MHTYVVHIAICPSPRGPGHDKVSQSVSHYSAATRRRRGGVGGIRPRHRYSNILRSWQGSWETSKGKVRNTALILGLFDERKIEASRDVWIATPWLLIITPQK